MWTHGLNVSSDGSLLRPRQLPTRFIKGKWFYDNDDNDIFINCNWVITRWQ